MDMGIKGRTALVCAASKGLGRGCAEALAAEGVNLVICARTAAPLDATAAYLRATFGVDVKAVACDITTDEGHAAALAACPAPDILVNNAAVTYFTRVEDFTAKRYALMFAVQVEAPFDMARLVLPGMRERGRGWILNISSLAAVHPTMPPGGFSGRGGTVYGMCKAAIERFSTGLAAELYADNIAVNALSPNKVVPTPGTLFHHLIRGEDDPRAEPPAVMAEAALMLCQRDPQSLTGRITYSQDLLAELGVPIPQAG